MKTVKVVAAWVLASILSMLVMFAPGWFFVHWMHPVTFWERITTVVVTLFTLGISIPAGLFVWPLVFLPLVGDEI